MKHSTQKSCSTLFSYTFVPIFWDASLRFHSLPCVCDEDGYLLCEQWSPLRNGGDGDGGSAHLHGTHTHVHDVHVDVNSVHAYDCCEEALT